MVIYIGVTESGRYLSFSACMRSISRHSLLPKNNNGAISLLTKLGSGTAWHTPPQGILKVYQPNSCSPVRSPSHLIIARNRSRKQEQKAHKRKVKQNLTAALRPIPTMPAPVLNLTPDSNLDQLSLLPQDISAEFTPSAPALAQLKVMAWSCRGRLYAHGNFVNSQVRFFLHQVGTMMVDRNVDIMWLNDARFLPGELNKYIPVLHEILPNCRLFQFPTQYVRTNSRTLSYNQMGGAVAIVTH